MSIPIVFAEVAALAERRHVKRIDQLPGCWEVQLDAAWWFALNGHREPLNCSRGPEVAPFSCYVEFNGWPAGIVTPGGGTIAAGAAANEDTLIEALRAAT